MPKRNAGGQPSSTASTTATTTAATTTDTTTASSSNTPTTAAGTSATGSTGSKGKPSTPAKPSSPQISSLFSSICGDANGAVQTAENEAKELESGLMAKLAQCDPTGILSSCTDSSGSTKTPASPPPTDPKTGKPKKSPGEVMKKMREDGAPDIDIAFQGMEFIIDGAVKIIDEAMATIKQITAIGAPDWTWSMKPWLVQKQNSLSAEIDTHISHIDKFNGQLQNAISVASYAISVENLENVLNASKMLKSKDMQTFWKKRIGIDKMAVPMKDVTESFMEEVDSNIQDSKKQRLIIFTCTHY